MALTDTKVIGVLTNSDAKPKEESPKREKLTIESKNKELKVSESINDKKATPQQEEEEILFGPNSEKWQLMAILTDGKNKKNSLDKNGNPKGIIGYELKALEDGLTYVAAKITSTLLSNPFAVPKTEVKTASKDEIIPFTKAEVGRLLADETMECVIAGGGVVAVLAFGKPVGNDATEGEEITELPFRPYLKGTRTTGKLAEKVPIKPILDTKAVPDAKNPRKSNLVQTLNEGFDRFKAVLEEKPKQAERRKAKVDKIEAEQRKTEEQLEAGFVNKVVGDNVDSVASKTESQNKVVPIAGKQSGASEQGSKDAKNTKVGTTGKRGAENAHSATKQPTSNKTDKSKSASAAARKRRNQAAMYRKAFDSKRS